MTCTIDNDIFKIGKCLRNHTFNDFSQTIGVIAVNGDNREFHSYYEFSISLTFSISLIAIKFS